MSKPSAQKGIAHIGIIVVVVVVVIAAALFFFDDFGEGPGPFQSKGPPSDPEAAKEWLSENIDVTNQRDFVNVGYEVPSWKEIEKIKKETSLERVYPTFMKAIQEMGVTTITVDLVYFADELADVGANTYFISPFYATTYAKEKGELELFYSGFSDPDILSEDEAKRAMIHSILMAKQQGFTVILMPDFPELQDGGLTNLSRPDEVESYMKEIILDLAPIAEEYGVEYLIPDNQLAMVLYTNGHSLEEVYARTNAYHADIVPKVKELYSGKIMYKMGGLDIWTNYDGISLEGADLFGFTGCYTNTPDEIAADIKNMAAQADKMSAKYGIPWINTEFFVRNEKDQIRDLGEVTATLPMEDYYKAGLASFEENAQGASGFTITSWLSTGKVRGTGAVPLIKEFFANY